MCDVKAKDASLWFLLGSCLHVRTNMIKLRIIYIFISMIQPTSVTQRSLVVTNSQRIITWLTPPTSILTFLKSVSQLYWLCSFSLLPAKQYWLTNKVNTQWKGVKSSERDAYICQEMESAKQNWKNNEYLKDLHCSWETQFHMKTNASKLLDDWISKCLLIQLPSWNQNWPSIAALHRYPHLKLSNLWIFSVIAVRNACVYKQRGNLKQTNKQKTNKKEDVLICSCENLQRRIKLNVQSAAFITVNCLNLRPASFPMDCNFLFQTRRRSSSSVF